MLVACMVSVLVCVLWFSFCWKCKKLYWKYKKLHWKLKKWCWKYKKVVGENYFWPKLVFLNSCQTASRFFFGGV